jgi:hypothetical protein
MEIRLHLRGFAGAGSGSGELCLLIAGLGDDEREDPSPEFEALSNLRIKNAFTLADPILEAMEAFRMRFAPLEIAAVND